MKKLLIVEDDFMIADYLEEILQEEGYEICGIASEVDQAIRLAKDQKPTFAVIDLRLADGRYGTEVGNALLADRDVGILYVSGNPDHPALIGAKGDGCISKPYSPDSVIAALAIIGDRLAGRPASGSFPSDFQPIPKSPDRCAV